MSMTKKVTKWTMVVDGDATGANRAFQSVGKSAGTLGSKIAKVGGLIAAAFSIGKIIQFGKESVQAMMEDQKSAALLAKTLQNVTHARQQDIDAVESYIRKTEESLGVQDDELRPAYAKLVRVTKDTTKAQKLLNLALDVSAGTGKDLSSVSMALSKALGGNYTALSRLDPTISKAILKTKDLNKMLEILSATYGGSATTRAKTFAYQMERLKIAFENIKEDVGYALLPKLQELAEWMNGEGIAALKTFFTVLFGGGSDTPGRDQTARVADSWKANVDPLQESAQGLAQAIRELTFAVSDLFKAFDTGTNSKSGLVGFVNLMTGLVKTVNALVTGLNKTVEAMDKVNKSAGGNSTGWKGKLFGLLSILTGADPQQGLQQLSGRAIGGTVNPGMSYLVGERGPELFSPTSSGFITPNGQVSAGSTPLNVTVNVHGSVVKERDLAVAVRDQIAQMMRRRGLDPSILGV